MATKQKNAQVRFNNFRPSLGMFVFAIVFAAIGFATALLTHAAGGSSISMFSNSADGLVHYSNQVSFNWSTTYKNSSSNTYFNPNIEVICYQNGKWTGMGHVYRMSTSPTAGMGLTGAHNYTFADGDLNRLDYSWYTDPSQQDQTKPESCHAALFHFSKNNKYMELAATTFQVNP